MVQDFFYLFIFYMNLLVNFSPPMKKQVSIKLIAEDNGWKVRPATLAVQLAANMIAGHLLLALRGSCFYYTQGLSPLTIIVSCTLFQLVIRLQTSNTK